MTAPRFTWEFRQEDIARNLREQGPARFLRWPISAEALYSADPVLGQRRLDLLSPSLRPHVYRFSAGDPPGDGPFDWHLVIQAYHLDKLLQRGYDLRAADSIYEFGGGFGAMVLLLRRMGYNGRYVIQDLPELLQLQDYWLQTEGIRDNVVLTTRPIAGEYDLFISNCALNEATAAAVEGCWGNVMARAYEICYDRCWRPGIVEEMAALTKRRLLNWEHTIDTIFVNHAYWTGVCY